MQIIAMCARIFENKMERLVNKFDVSKLPTPLLNLMVRFKLTPQPEPMQAILEQVSTVFETPSETVVDTRANAPQVRPISGRSIRIAEYAKQKAAMSTEINFQENKSKKRKRSKNQTPLIEENRAMTLKVDTHVKTVSQVRFKELRNMKPQELGVKLEENTSYKFVEYNKNGEAVFIDANGNKLCIQQRTGSSTAHLGDARKVARAIAANSKLK